MLKIVGMKSISSLHLKKESVFTLSDIYGSLLNTGDLVNSK